MMNHPTVVDLFCGCGGFGLGAELAGFRSLAAIDIEPTLQSAYTRNFPGTKTVIANVARLTLDDWKEILGDTRPDGVIGGPPCQGFSRIGQRAADDPRNTLIGSFFEQVKLLSPKFFVMENVDGLLDEKGIDILMTALKTVSDEYYILDPIVVKASDYGAPTTRTRVIVVGYRPGQMPALQLSDFLPSPGVARVTVKDAISDLAGPIITARGQEEYSWSKYATVDTSQLSAYATLMRTLPPVGLGSEVGRKKLRAGECSGYEATIHSESVSARYGSTPNGGTDPVSKAMRLAWDGFCPTLRAGTGADKGSHQAVRPIHPSEPRVITVREAARLQGFPDWFMFHPTKWSSFRMIGNSVSPIVSKAILSVIRKNLELQLAA